jgi:hypothetical protein
MFRHLVCSVFMALFATGCFFAGDDDDYYYAPVGTLIVDWTVDATKDPAACRDFGVDSVDIVVRTRRGAFVDEILPYCERFQARFDLAPGAYTVEAVLEDATGVLLTTSVQTSARVYDSETTVSAVDFPADSFL